MKLIRVLPAVGILVAMLAATGCAGTPSQSKSASAERTPSWMKHHVVGSRIPRRVDAKGRPVSSDNVVMTSNEGLEDLPSVTRNISRGPSLR
jgi:hypothetical protein